MKKTRMNLGQIVINNVACRIGEDIPIEQALRYVAHQHENMTRERDQILHVTDDDGRSYSTCEQSSDVLSYSSINTGSRNARNYCLSASSIPSASAKRPTSSQIPQTAVDPPSSPQD
jgi:hypothetical protein